MFRAVKKRDRAAFLEMVGEFYHSAAVLHPIPEKYYENTFDELMRSGEYLEAVLFEVDGRAAGYALLSKSYSPEVGGPVVWIEEVYVREAYRSLGVGGKFFAFLDQRYHGHMKRLRLEVEPANDRAVALYERLGFRQLPYIQMVKDYD